MHLSLNKITSNIKSARHTLSEIRKDTIHKCFPDKYKYVLLEKAENMNVKNSAYSLSAPEGAETVSVVTIGKRGTDTLYKTITAYFDKNKKLLRKQISGNGINIRRNYETTGNNVAKLRKIVTEKFNDDVCAFEPVQIEEQKTYKLTDRKNSSTKLTLFKNVIDGDVIHSTITEYPFNGHGALRYLRKTLGLDLEFRKDIPYIVSTFETSNAKFPVSDRFLPFRFILDEKKKLHSMTKFLLKEKGLEKLNTEVYFSDKVGKHTAGYFDDTTNEIVYNPEAKSHVADLSAHEVEHAYQYSQIGRIDKGYTQYARKAKKLYGGIIDDKSRLEAHKYAVAAQNYPKMNNDDKPSEIPGYTNNYLEVKAREAAQKVKNEYDEGAKFLREQFTLGNF